ncbi:hypothetical protein DM02DRAFT_637009, partial [Periconia macrospinosa]
ACPYRPSALNATKPPQFLTMLPDNLPTRSYVLGLRARNTSVRAEATLQGLEITAGVLGCLALTILTLASVFYLIQRHWQHRRKHLENSEGGEEQISGFHVPTLRYPETKSLPLLPLHASKGSLSQSSRSSSAETPDWLKIPLALPPPLAVSCPTAVPNRIPCLYAPHRIGDPQPSVWTGNSPSVYSTRELRASNSTLFEEETTTNELELRDIDELGRKITAESLRINTRYAKRDTLAQGTYF